MSKTVIKTLRKAHTAIIAEKVGSRTGWHPVLSQPDLPSISDLETYLGRLRDPQLKSEAEHHISVINRERR